MSSPQKRGKRPRPGPSKQEEPDKKDMKVYVPSAGLYPCLEKNCLLEGTPPVGTFPLAERAMGSSLVGLAKGGAKYRMGRGKITEGAVNAAYKLLKRECPQVTQEFKVSALCLFPISSFLSSLEMSSQT